MIYSLNWIGEDDTIKQMPDSGINTSGGFNQLQWLTMDILTVKSKVNPAEVIDLYETGMTHKEIAEKLQVNIKTIQRLLKRIGYTSRKKGTHKRFGSHNHKWKGGTTINSGYILKRCPGHPRAKTKGSYVPEHILVMEHHIGRYLFYYGSNNPENEIVHHINENKQDNRIENLQLMTARQHSSLHGQNSACSKAVKRLDTGEIYKSASLAGVSINKSKNAVIAAIRRNCRAGGTYWEYV